MPFIHTFDPVLFHLGPLEIRWYGLAYVFGFIVSYIYIRWMIDKKQLKITYEEMYDWVFYLMLGVLIGSRLFHIIFWDLSFYIANPLHIFYLWEGGMSFHGGLVGVIIGTLIFWKKVKKRVSITKLFDTLCIPSLFSLALGRIANFINGELPGTVTDVSWCWYFPGVEGCRHPQVLYSAATRFLIVGWLIFLTYKDYVKKRFKDGFISINFLFLVGLGRFLIDFFREDVRYFSLTAGQWLSSFMIIIGLYLALKYYRKDFKRIFK